MRKLVAVFLTLIFLFSGCKSQNVRFQIYTPEGELVSMTFTYPEVTTMHFVDTAAYWDNVKSLQKAIGEMVERMYD